MNRLDKLIWLSGGNLKASSISKYGPSEALNLAQPTGFYQQLEAARALYGEPTMTRDDEVISMITTLLDWRIIAW